MNGSLVQNEAGCSSSDSERWESSKAKNKSEKSNWNDDLEVESLKVGKRKLSVKSSDKHRSE